MKLNHLVVLSLFVASPVFATEQDRFKLAVEFLKTACVTGEQVVIEGQADGGISILKRGASGSFRFSQSELKGVVNSTNEAIRTEENRQIRECMQPHIQQILTIIASPPEAAAEGVSILPNRQWMPVGVPLPILDGRVTVVLSEIREARRRKPYASVRVEVPRRKAYTSKLYNTETMTFDYRSFTYKITITNVELQDQRAKITVIRL